MIYSSIIIFEIKGHIKMNSWIKNALTVLTLVGILGCAENVNLSGNQDAGGPSKQSNEVDWNKIPERYNPSTEDYRFVVTDVKRLFVSPIGFGIPIKLIYSESTKNPNGYLRLYKVWAKSAKWGYFDSDYESGKISITRYGEYSCSISVENGEISALEGGCYLKVEIYLPLNSKVEVYSSGNRISDQFYAMTAEELIDVLDDRINDSGRTLAVDDFVASNKKFNEQRSITSRQLGTVLNKFISIDSKLDSLSKMHGFISDRNNLSSMIDSEFSYSDRPKARKIVGI